MNDKQLIQGLVRTSIQNILDADALTRSVLAGKPNFAHGLLARLDKIHARQSMKRK